MNLKDFDPGPRPEWLPAGEPAEIAAAIRATDPALRVGDVLVVGPDALVLTAKLPPPEPRVYTLRHARVMEFQAANASALFKLVADFIDRVYAKAGCGVGVISFSIHTSDDGSESGTLTWEPVV